MSLNDRLKQINVWYVLIGILLLRLISMAWIPLMDTTEARYGEMARMMMASNDWITPWFEPGIPFWGKPPLSFWMQALSFKVFGVNELAVRFPSWLSTLASMWLLWRLAIASCSRDVGKNALLIYSSCALVYVVAGGVLTDPYLTLSTTWCMVAFYLAAIERKWYWRYGFFIGLALGLLAKGPLAPVLVFGAIIPWLFFNKQALTHLKALPWLSGSLLTLVISLPWYIVAEIKTPGFLNYFIVGEHLMRFIDPGWTGDLYGSGHKQPKGMIWVQWVMASFPWGLVAIAMLCKQLFFKDGRSKIFASVLNGLVRYLFWWSVLTLMFFSLSGNILWTYVLPALPAFALLLAMTFNAQSSTGVPLFKNGNNVLKLASIVTPILILVAFIAVSAAPNILKTEKGLMAYVAAHPLKNKSASDTPVYYLESQLPYSARFYSQEHVEKLENVKVVREKLEQVKQMYLAVPENRMNELKTQLNLKSKIAFGNKRYRLIELSLGN